MSVFHGFRDKKGYKVQLWYFFWNLYWLLLSIQYLRNATNRHKDIQMGGFVQ